MQQIPERSSQTPQDCEPTSPDHLVRQKLITDNRDVHIIIAPAQNQPRSIQLDARPRPDGTRKMAMKVIDLPEGKQPDRLDATAILALLEPEHQRPGNRQNLPPKAGLAISDGPDKLVK